MNLRRLFNTSAMRIALRYAGIYAVFMTLGLSILFWASSDYVDEQISTGLKQKMQDLQRIDSEQGRKKLLQALKLQSDINRESRPLFLFLAPNHKKVMGDLNGWPPQLGIDGQVVNVWIEDSLILGQETKQDGYWPMIAETLADGSQLLLAQSLKQAEELQEVILYTIIAIFLISVMLALTMGWFISRTLLARIDKINITTQAITAGDLSQRVPGSDKNDEFDQLSNHLNNMLSRIELLLTGMRQVTDNIAHDLRKPLSRLRNRLEITLLEKREPHEYQQVLSETIEDADELIITFNALLEIAQTEAKSFRGEWKTVDLSKLLKQLGELYQELAESKGVSLIIAVQDELAVTGNRHLLAQAVSNLLDNAIKYTDTDGQIILNANLQHQRVMINISDNGVGIPADKYGLVLERFFRLDSARSTSGNGLGLSLVKAVMNLHGANLEFEDNHPGLVVQIVFAKNIR